MLKPICPVLHQLLSLLLLATLTHLPTAIAQDADAALEDASGDTGEPTEGTGAADEDEALEGDPLDGEAPEMSAGEAIFVLPPPDAEESTTVQGEERLGASIAKTARGAVRKDSASSVLIFDAEIGKPFGVEQQVKSTCVKTAKTCTGWKAKCSQWAKAFGGKTCTGWTTSCVQEAKTCSGWKIETRSLLHAPRLVVRYSGRDIDGIKRDIEDAIKAAGAASVVSAYASGGAAAYKTFIETLKAELKRKAYEIGKLDVTLRDETKWSSWSTRETKSKSKKAPKKKKTKKKKKKKKKK